MFRTREFIFRKTFLRTVMVQCVLRAEITINDIYKIYSNYITIRDAKNKLDEELLVLHKEICSIQIFMKLLLLLLD